MEFLIFSGNQVVREIKKLIGPNPYLAEKGDSVNLTINMDKKWLKFTGNGSDKMNCQFLLNYIPMPIEASGPFFFESNIGGMPQSSESEAKVRELHFQNCIAILESYEKIIPDRIYNRLEIDLLADIKYWFVHQKLMTYRMTNNQKVRQEIENYILHNKNSLLLNKQDRLIQSPKYTDFVLEYEELLYRMKSGKKNDPADLFTSLYQNIKTSYTGLLRERLLITFLLEGSRKYLRYQLPILSEATALMKEPSNKLFLQEYQNMQSKGTEAFPFVFRDEKGNRHTLKNYSDKIIIMDFWFTGCLGCLQMPPVMKAMMEKLKDRKDIIFLSINTDATTEMWLSSLKGGNYSFDGQIHLKTLGNRSVDRFILNYNIHSYPQLFIIGKNGLILSTNPPDPRLDNGKDIIKMIEMEP